MRTAGGRWRGRRADLVVLGTVGTLASTGLAGCSDNGTFHRNIYKSEADCLLDYNSTTCLSAGTRSMSGTFLGPVYRMAKGRAAPCRNDDPGPGRTGLGLLGGSARLSVVSVERGGFGTSCPSRGTSSRSRSRSWSSWGG